MWKGYADQVGGQTGDAEKHPEGRRVMEGEQGGGTRGNLEAAGTSAPP